MTRAAIFDISSRRFSCANKWRFHPVFKVGAFCPTSRLADISHPSKLDHFDVSSKNSATFGFFARRKAQTDYLNFVIATNLAGQIEKYIHLIDRNIVSNDISF